MADWYRVLVTPHRPLSLKEQLRDDLQDAVDMEYFELAASLRNGLRLPGAEPPPIPNTS